LKEICFDEEIYINLINVIKECSLVVSYDNTEIFNRFAIYMDGSLITVSDETPLWYKKIEAVLESEQEIANGAEAARAEKVFEELEKKHFG